LKYMIINVWINWINYNSMPFNVWINNITIQRNLNIWTWFWNVLECFGTFFFVSEDDTEMPRCVPLCPCDLSRPLKHRRWIRSTLLSIHRDFWVDFW
jgi:hypothetical protein